MTEVRLPMRAVSGNHMNGREHWRARHRRTLAERSAAYLMTPRGVTLPCAVTLTREAPRALDSHDNLRTGLKGFVDGIADRLGVNDNDSRVTWNYSQRKAKEYAVVIEIRPVAGAAGA